MGGEYLTNQDEGEVEIARIEIASTTADVTSVYARRDGTKIHYRVVDEYRGETLSGATERESIEPLTLGELEETWRQHCGTPTSSASTSHHSGASRARNSLVSPLTPLR
jgi:hypothetical protein